MKPGYKLYRVCFIIARIFIAIVYRLEIKGRENIPEGPAMVCANHSNSIDPFFIAFAFGIEHQMHIIAKAELFRIPIFAQLLKRLGMISVNRGITDVTTVKRTLGYLRDGEKVAIFPEGTRVTRDDEISAKNGAIKLAERANVPIVPVFIPREKKLFRRITVVIGQPYYIERQAVKRTQECYSELAGDLMVKIKQLKQTVTIRR